MLRDYRRTLDRLHLLATAAILFAAYATLHHAMRGRPVPLLPFSDYLPAISLLAAAVLFGLSRGGFSALSPLASPIGLLRDLAVCYAFGALAYAFAAYSLRLPHLSRAFIFGGLAWGYAAASLWHLAAYRLYRGMRARGLDAKAVLLVGDAASVPPVRALIEGHPALGLRVAGVLATESPLSEEAVERWLDGRVVDYAVVADFRRDPAFVETVMAACRERGVEIWLKPDFIPAQVQFSRVDYLLDTPLFVFSMLPRQGLAVLLKRAIDITAALALLPLLALPMLVIAALIRRSGGPAIYAQRRIGLNGREFTMYKFRTMAGTKGKALRNELKGPVFKMADDPRVTPLGRVLRKYSLDELPQLWNVLMGDMSLVGPRPPLPSEVGKYKSWQRRRLSMRPGITGLWQVAGRNSIPDFDDWVKLDLSYIDGWSLWLDLKIMARTIPAIVKGTGL
jgi:exopolysaccharide biosynthesis polyprenyl glycosylphosphotransferase